MIRRRWLVVPLFAAPLVVIGVACSFPDVTYAPAGGAEAGATIDASEPSDARPDVEVTGYEGGSLVDANDCAQRTPCDCDGDHYYAVGCDAGLPDGAVANDCDDLDSFRHPDQIFSDAGPTRDGTWDWNCSGKVEKAYAKSGCTNFFGNCSGDGIRTDAPCGAFADWYVCTPIPFGCKDQYDNSSVYQSCK